MKNRPVYINLFHSSRVMFYLEHDTRRVQQIDMNRPVFFLALFWNVMRGGRCGGEDNGKVCLVFDHRYSSMCVSVLSAEHTHTSKGNDDHMLNKPYHQV